MACSVGNLKCEPDSDPSDHPYLLKISFKPNENMNIAVSLNSVLAVLSCQELVMPHVI